MSVCLLKTNITAVAIAKWDVLKRLYIGRAGIALCSLSSSPMAPCRNLARSVMAAASIVKIWEWSKENKGDPDRTTKLHTGCFKMKLWRKTDIQEEKDSKLTHKEEQTTVLELTYNYGVAEDTKGSACAQQKPE